MPEYTVVDICEDRLEAAYFLVRSIAPDMSLTDWRKRAKALSNDGIVLGLSGPSDMLYGILAGRRRVMPRCGATLDIDLLAVFELTRGGTGRSLLLNAARERAGRLECDALAWPPAMRPVG
jgi:hypothetical protein